MERLTTREGKLVELEPYLKGNTTIPIGVFISAACKAFKLLSEYEATGYSPSEVKLGMSVGISVKNNH